MPGSVILRRAWRLLAFAKQVPRWLLSRRRAVVLRCNSRSLKGTPVRERQALFSKTSGATFKGMHLLAVKPRQGYVFHSDISDRR